MHYDALVMHRPEDLARAVGDRVKHERLSRQWTLDDLAQAAGLSRRVVVNVEQAATNPSLATLLRLSEALGVGLPSLVEPPTQRTFRVTHSGEGSPLWRGEHGGRGVLVANADTPDALELWDWTLQPGESRASEAHRPGTREMLQMREGTLTLQIDGENVELTTGDAISFVGDRPHTYSNQHVHPARFCLAVFEPGAAPPSRTEDSHA